MKKKEKLQLFLKKISSSLPEHQYASTAKVKILGEDVLLSNTKEIDGKPVEEEKEYQMSIPFYNNINHLRRIRRAYSNNGVEGVLKYCKPYVRPESFNIFSDLVRDFHKSI